MYMQWTVTWIQGEIFQNNIFVFEFFSLSLMPINNNMNRLAVKVLISGVKIYCLCNVYAMDGKVDTGGNISEQYICF